MIERDEIESLFSQKLGQGEATVNPELWNAIASKIPSQSISSSTSSTKGISSVTKWIIACTSVASVAVGVYFYTESTESKSVDKEKSKIQTESSLKTQASDTKTTEQKVENEQTSITTSEQNELVLSNQHKETESVIEYTENTNTVEAINFVPTDVKCGTSDVNVIESNTKKVDSEQAPEKASSSTETISKPISIKPLPNTFTINNDGINDVFFIEVEGLKDFVLTILDQQNKVVFTSSDVHFKWDGRDLAGNEVAAGKYIYFFTALDENNNPVSKSSNLNIFRR